MAKPGTPRPTPNQGKLQAAGQPRNPIYSMAEKHRLKKVAGTALVTLVGIFLGSLALIPRVGASTNTPSAGNYPSNQQFTFTNNTLYALRNVRIAMGICEMSGENAPYDENAECDYKNPGSLSFPGWNRDLFRTDDSITVSPGEKIAGKMSGINVGFTLTYQPWRIPMRCEKIFAYKTKRGADGQIYWFAVPNPGSKGCNIFGYWI